jgi:hypothetical protein
VDLQKVADAAIAAKTAAEALMMEKMKSLLDTKKDAIAAIKREVRLHFL